MQSILVCDDDKQIVEAIDIYLTGEGFEVIKAYDGFEALELLQNHSVNLMIIDVMMPGLDGIRTTLKVRETSSIPIIILSAKSEDADKILGLNIGEMCIRDSEISNRSKTFFSGLQPFPEGFYIIADRGHSTHSCYDYSRIIIHLSLIHISSSFASRYACLYSIGASHSSVVTKRVAT